MPYIKPEDRETAWDSPQTAGELNFAITSLLDQYVYSRLNYQGINDCLGALEGAKLEFYRRVVAPYEDKKLLENGDVYASHEAR